jgi:hypothetical protein
MASLKVSTVLITALAYLFRQIEDLRTENKNIKIQSDESLKRFEYSKDQNVRSLEKILANMTF